MGHLEYLYAITELAKGTKGICETKSGKFWRLMFGFAQGIPRAGMAMWARRWNQATKSFGVI
jgi:hypothetical protein